MVQIKVVPGDLRKYSNYLIDLHSLDLACMPDMGTSAQVNQWPTSNKDS